MLHALFVWIVIGLAAGWLASLFLGGRGLIRYIIVGMIGSVVGGYLVSVTGIGISIGNFWLREILTAAIGAAIVIIVARILGGEDSMSPARKTFVWIFGLSIGLGLILAIANMIAPDAVSVSWNDENVEGVNSLWVGLFSGAIPGLMLGLIAAGVVALFTRGKKS